VDDVQINVAVVPEPEAFTLIAAGLGFLYLKRKVSLPS
jgi:hypothetical protein